MKSTRVMRDSSCPTLSVVVPVHNEAKNLASLIEHISKSLERVDHEIIYVNDGSTDSSRKELERLASKFATLRVFHHRTSCGQSRAVVTGVRQARAELIATLDGDGQNDPADLPRLLEAFQVAADPALAMIIGNRASRRDTAWRRFSSRFAAMVRAKMLRDHTPDSGCGIKMFRREVFLELPNFNHMHRYLPVLFRNNGYSVQSMEVNHLDRWHGRSNYGTVDRLLNGLSDVLGVMWLTRRTNVPEIEGEVSERATAKEDR
ncbi:glycosyltransferase family 2 protein [Pontiella sulfatireligans]|uniref:Dodecaprenyl-phosphate galacturonate synthase n=1 Tax=Pontiella sulfatireligans TaxID=2750658 RepID=A0A6C2UL66_9BACT|nr:glycosyltransferase family 2 protein [Pontiella sulfatireligans]VGO20985.1 Dodecaprenyl-phosphate galacturonate synthase [Pontiella sulfatireligans]